MGPNHITVAAAAARQADLRAAAAARLPVERGAARRITLRAVRLTAVPFAAAR